MAEVDRLALAELAERSASENGPLSRARGRGGQEIRVPAPHVGALLAWLASGAGARSVVEVGSGAGVSGLWLLRGMDAKGTLTSIEPDPRAQGAAMAAFEDAGVTARVRSILGEPAEVLDRLSDAGYDLALFQRAGTDDANQLEHAARLVKPGGLLVVLGLSGQDYLAARALRAFAASLVDDERFATVALPYDDGVLLARRLPEGSQGSA